MGDKTVSVRVRFEGGDQVKAGLQEVGREGSRAIQNIGTVSAQTGAKLQNAGYQVSDFFVQVAGGTAPSRALAQQLPQLLQGFGLLGVAASVLIAALPSLWSMFSSGAGDAEALEEQVKSLADAMKAYEAAAQAASAKPSDLFAKFGADAGQAKEALEIQRQIAAARAQNALTQTSRSIVDLFGVPDDADLERVKQRIAELKEAIANAAADPDQIYKFDFGTAQRELAALESRTVNSFSAITDAIGQSLEGNEAQVMAVVAALRQVEQANGVAAQAEAMANLRTALIEAADGGRTLNEEAMLLLGSLTDAELAALGLAQVDIASGIAAGADEADRLARNLARAQAAQSMLDQMAIEFSPGGQAMLKYGGRTPGGTDAQNALADRNKPKEVRGGRGGGGGGGADPDIARAKALTEGVRTETEKYAAALEEVNRLKQKGLITDETYNRQLDKLNDKLGETGDLGKKAASAIRSAFDGIFDDPQQALKDLAKQLAMMALYQGLAKAFPGAFGADGVVPLVNANGNVFANGSVQAFAAGGIVSSPTMFPMRNGLGLMGEAGPEAIMPLTRIGGKLGVASTGGGRSAPVIVNVVNQSGAAVETTSERGGPNGERIIDMKITESLTSGRQDKALRRFGSKPQRVLR